MGVAQVCCPCLFRKIVLCTAQKVSLWPSQADISCESVFFREQKIRCFSFVLAVSSLGTFDNGFLVVCKTHHGREGL